MYKELKDIKVFTEEEEFKHFKMLKTLKEEIKHLNDNKTLMKKEQKILKEKTTKFKNLKEKIITNYLKWAITIAAKYIKDKHLDLEDLIMAGSIGLNKAVDSFDHNKGVRFSTYSKDRIEKEILEEINKSKLIRIPSHAITKRNKIKKAENELTHELKRTPTTSEIAKHLKWKEEDVCFYINATNISITEKEFNKNKEENEKIKIEEIKNIDAYDDFTNNNIEMLMRFIDELTNLEKEIIINKYGIFDGVFKSNKALASILNLGQEKIRIIHKEALEKLKEKFAKIRRYKRKNENNI